MTHRERLETAWRFEEPDRVPIELLIAPKLRTDPRAARLMELIDEHADNFVDGVPAPEFGFMGFPTHYSEEVIEERPGQYRKIRRVHETQAGTFTAITYHPEHSNDYGWEKRFILNLEEFDRITQTPRRPATWDRDAYYRKSDEIGGEAFPIMGLFHPLGDLVRYTTMEEVYIWLREEPKLVHRFLEAANDQIVETIDLMQPRKDEPLCFITWAHEMLIPPWIGHDLFDEFVLPYDRKVNAAIHKHGGRLRIHCHGNPMAFLEKLADMGADGIEPLEPPPAGDVDLTEAKRRVGGRMMLSGNITSPQFVSMEPEDVRRQVREAIHAAAPGGGFSLRTTGGHGGTSTTMSPERLQRVLANCQAYILAGLEYGQYPIKVS